MITGADVSVAVTARL